MALVGTGQGCGAQDRYPATRNCLDAGSAMLCREPWAKASASMEGSQLGRGRAERPCIRRTVLLCPELGRAAEKEEAGD